MGQLAERRGCASRDGAVLPDIAVATRAQTLSKAENERGYGLYNVRKCEKQGYGMVLGRQKSGVAGDSDVSTRGRKGSLVISHEGKRGTSESALHESLPDNVSSTTAHEACSASFGTCRTPLMRLRLNSIQCRPVWMPLLAAMTRASIATSSLVRIPLTCPIQIDPWPL